MVLTLLSLVVGLVLMAAGGKINKKYSKQLMTARVILQFCAIFSLFMLFAFAR
jgi:hypothetical protein